MNPSVTSEWNLHLLRVVIDDGNPELHVDDVFHWPVTFWSSRVLTNAVENTKKATPLGSGYYRVNAEVIYLSRDPDQAACILDFGIRAISEVGGLLGVPLPLQCKVGEYVTGEVRFNLDLCTALTPYDLNHKWRVNRIFADLTDFCLYPGDVAAVSYREVSGTDAIRAGSYVLHCSNIDR